MGACSGSRKENGGVGCGMWIDGCIRHGQTPQKAEEIDFGLIKKQLNDKENFRHTSSHLSCPPLYQ